LTFSTAQLLCTQINKGTFGMDKEQFAQAIKSATTPLPGSIPYHHDYVFSVKQKYDGLPLIYFLNESVPMISNDEWLAKITSGNLKVNDKPAKPDMMVIPGYRVSHTSDERVDPPVSPNIQLVHKDNELLIVNKPAPLPMHPCGRFRRNTLISILRSALGIDFKITHRIDANTTGLVVLAKNKRSATAVMSQFENRTIAKEYLALVNGIVENDHFESTKAIGKEIITGGARALCDMGDEAHSIFEVVERYHNLNQTLLKVIPKSGRTNQIRLHLVDIGHTIVGDHNYHDTTCMEDAPMTYDSDQLCLHAWKITFKHPATGVSTTYTAPVPDKFPQISNKTETA